MYLFVQPSRARSSLQRVVIGSRRRELGLSTLPLIPLAEALDEILANRKPTRPGNDPMAHKAAVFGADAVRGWPSV